MKPKSFTERGQALVIFALAAIGIFGIVALAIDGSAKLSDRRHAQNAADTAALAGALALGSENAYWKIDALNRAGDNGYSDDLVSSNVEVYRCDEGGSSCGTYAGSSQYVQVIITSYVNTSFARVIGINQTINTVQAVALAKKAGPIFEGSSLVALNPNSGCPGSFLVGGDSTITLNGGGMLVNSDESDCAFEQQGCSMNLVINGGSIVSTGDENVDFDGCYAGSSPPVTYNEDVTVFPTDIEMPDVPPECTSPLGSYSSNDFTQTTTLNPGLWDVNEFPPKSGGGITVYDNMVMNPGVYCMNDLIKLNDQHLTLTGTGVTLYIRNGHGFKFEGGTINLTAPETGDYAGYLIIVETDFMGAPEECKIDGNPVNTYGGTIFAPYCALTINGSSTATTPTNYSTQIIAYELKLNGTSDITFTYDPDKSAKSRRKVGLMK